MSVTAGSSLYEVLPELSHELSHEAVHEREPFLGNILGGLSSLLGEGEEEDEGSYEWEGAFEDEYAGEAGFELSHEYEWEHEGAHEGEAESEQFFGSIANLARRAVASPTLRRMASSAAKGALNAGLQASPLPPSLTRSIMSILRESEVGHELSMLEAAMEAEGESEWEGELNPVRHVYPDAMMEHLGAAAAEAESEVEAFAFLAPLVPLAMKALPLALKAAPKVARIAAKVAPKLIKGVQGVVRGLGKTQVGRQLRRTIPRAVTATIRDVAKQAAAGRRVTPQGAVRMLARRVASGIATPQRAAQTYRRSRALDRRYHRQVQPALASAATAAGVSPAASISRTLGGLGAAMGGISPALAAAAAAAIPSSNGNGIYAAGPSRPFAMRCTCTRICQNCGGIRG